jgi:rhodanese-related sulfurtransferase
MSPSARTTRRAATGLDEILGALRAVTDHLTPAAVATELDAGAALLVDVREPAETSYGVIPGAVLVPRGTLELTADRGSPRHVEGFVPGRRVIVYCSTGVRSVLAVRSLRELGYRDVAHLDGGLDAWIAEGRSMTGPIP